MLLVKQFEFLITTNRIFRRKFFGVDIRPVHLLERFDNTITDWIMCYVGLQVLEIDYPGFYGFDSFGLKFRFVGGELVLLNFEVRICLGILGRKKT